MALTTVDDVVRMAIEALFPDQTIPDENNHLPGGRQHKAPDHGILGGRVFIERKSRNGTSDDKVGKWFDKASARQEERIVAYGEQNVRNLINMLPDPARANADMIEAILRQTLKSVKDSRRKFEDHANYIENASCLRAVIVSDNTEIEFKNDFEEEYFGRKMGGRKPEDDATGMIDAIILVKHPRYTMDGPNSYWFKCLIKKRLTHGEHETIRMVADSLHNRLSRYNDFAPYMSKFVVGAYQPLLV